MEPRLVGDALDLSRATPQRRQDISLRREQLRAVESAECRDGALHVITGGRQHGKTTLALEWLLGKPNRVLVTRDRALADHLCLLAGLPRRSSRIVSYRQLQNEGQKPNTDYGIDETVDILAQLLGLSKAPALLTVATAEPWQS